MTISSKTSTHKVIMVNPTIGDLRSFMESTSNVGDGARVQVTSTSDARDGNYVTIQITEPIGGIT